MKVDKLFIICAISLLREHVVRTGEGTTGKLLELLSDSCLLIRSPAYQAYLEYGNCIGKLNVYSVP